MASGPVQFAIGRDVVPTEPGYYWVTDAHGEKPRRRLVQVVSFYPLGVPVLKVLRPGIVESLPLDYFAHYSGPIVEPECAAVPLTDESVERLVRSQVAAGLTRRTDAAFSMPAVAAAAV